MLLYGFNLSSRINGGKLVDKSFERSPGSLEELSSEMYVKIRLARYQNLSEQPMRIIMWFSE